LSTNVSSLTAIANDYSFEVIFARQLGALGAIGDVAVGLSTSGNSVNAIEFAQARVSYS
jgi:D-sedoheptulose 7-phosphate isomerase